ncbi:DegT/DnrJ/EryC1/StrS family aminotransferase [Streptomyces sp. NPDC050560]|uniref:DegT/DnrJ/EryC1/StrS family aminotransferase n=1 Tax=Streptomyces sp. NPDC050560 TaxID=3365630 RepID=UPI0037B4BCA6
MRSLAALRAAGIGIGDEVIVSAFGNTDITGSIVELGALPVFADIELDTYSLDPDAVAAAIGPATAAVVAVHRFGRPAPMAALHALGKRHGLLVLEEDDVESELHGGRAIDGADAVSAARRFNASVLDYRLRGVLTPAACPRHTYRQYVVRVPGNGRPDRDAFARAARRKGIACTVPVKTPAHRLPGFRRSVFLPETERAADETLALPLGADLAKREMQRMSAACNALGGLLQPA